VAPFPINRRVLLTSGWMETSFLTQPHCVWAFCWRSWFVSIELIHFFSLCSDATFRVPQLFQLRYLIRQFLLPGKFAMLQIPIKISASEDK
jgi:hypothetical protein